MQSFFRFLSTTVWAVVLFASSYVGGLVYMEQVRLEDTANRIAVATAEVVRDDVCRLVLEDRLLAMSRPSRIGDAITSDSLATRILARLPVSDPALVAAMNDVVVLVGYRASDGTIIQRYTNRGSSSPKVIVYDRLARLFLRARHDSGIRERLRTCSRDVTEALRRLDG